MHINPTPMRVREQRRPQRANILDAYSLAEPSWSELVADAVRSIGGSR